MQADNDPEHFIDALKKRVLDGKEIAFEEARQLLAMDGAGLVARLLAAAGEITRHYHGTKVALCGLVNAKSYLCGEDCAFCAQSVRYQTGAEQYGLIPEEEVVETAKRFESQGILDFCIVTSGAKLNDREFEKVLGMFERLRRETTLNLDGSLGWLDDERLRRLKAAGVRRINSNLQTSGDYYPQIVSTHPYQERLGALDVLRRGHMEICSGGILAMGETPEDRLRMAFELKPYEPHCIPINILNPRPGTPLENQPAPDPLEMIRTIAVFRFVHPRANIKLAGGREKNLSREEQELALRSGANGLIVGGYLTSAGNPIGEDLEMLRRAGFCLPGECGPAEKKCVAVNPH
jgi:biotin synthase